MSPRYDTFYPPFRSSQMPVARYVLSAYRAYYSLPCQLHAYAIYIEAERLNMRTMRCERSASHAYRRSHSAETYAVIFIFRCSRRYHCLPQRRSCHHAHRELLSLPFVFFHAETAMLFDRSRENGSSYRTTAAPRVVERCAAMRCGMRYTEGARHHAHSRAIRGV